MKVKEKDVIRKDQTPELVAVRAQIMPRLHNYEQMNLKYQQEIDWIPSRILSIDPGITNVAVALIDLEFGNEITSKIELPEFAQTATKMRYLEFVIEQWVRYFRPDLIAKEGVAFGQTHGVSDSGKMQYMIERVAMEWLIPCMTITNSSMRAYLKATERGATKSEVMKRVLQKFGKDLPSEDETDAYAIGMTAKAILTGEYVVAKTARRKKAEAKGK